MGFKRKLQRKHQAEEGQALTLDSMAEMVRDILAPAPNASAAEAADLDTAVEGIVRAALRAEPGVSEDDPRSYEELMEEVKRRAHD